MKKILLVLLVLLVTGCSGKYDLTITDKKKVEEKFVLSIHNEDILNSNYTIDEYLDHYSYIYSSSNNFKKYNIKTKKSNPDSYFIVKRSYKNLQDYINSNTFKSMYSSAEIEDTGKYISFTTSRNDYLYNLKNDMLLSNENKYESFEINIKFYNEVVDNNADKVDEKNNIYTWYVDETRSAEQSFIYFKLGPKVKYFVKFKDYILNNLAAIIVVVSIIGLVGISILYIVYKSKKNNEI